MDNLKEHRREVMKGARYLRSVNSKIELIARLLSVREQQKVHDYVTQKARVDQFNEGYNRWLTPWVIFLVVMILIGIGVWLVPVKACGDLPPMDETINGIRAEAI